MYVKSDKIKFYPSAYRYYVDNGVSVVTDEEASRNTEYNITSHIAKVFHSTKGSFIISEDNDTNLEFFIGGYYVKVDNVATNLLNNFSSDTDIYANIKTTLVTPPPTQGNWDNLFEVVEFEHEYKPLDYKSGSNIEFKGISFEDSENANATFSLHLFTRENTNSPFTLVAPSKFILTLGDILGNNGKSALDELKTKTLLATTINGVNATFSGTVGAVNVNVGNQLTVTTKIVLGTSSITLNNGAFVFDNDITFASAKNVGTTTVPVNNVYATNINLGASLVPTSQTVNLGAANNKINTIYANNVNATNINISGNLIPTNIYVELGSDASPLGRVTTVSLSAPYVELENIGSLRNDGILYLGNKYLLPMETQFTELGSSTLQFNNVYAQYFRGALKGNADTATKLDSDKYIGNSSTPVYFNRGLPVITNWNTEKYNKLSDAGLYSVINEGVSSTATSFTASRYGQNANVYQALTKIDDEPQKFTLCLVSFKIKNSADVEQLTFCIDKISRTMGPNDTNSGVNFKAAASNPVIYNNTIYELQTAKTSTGELEIKLRDITNGEYRALKCITVVNL